MGRKLHLRPLPNLKELHSFPTLQETLYLEGVWNGRTLLHCIEAVIMRPTGDKELLTWSAIPRGRF